MLRSTKIETVRRVCIGSFFPVLEPEVVEHPSLDDLVYIGGGGQLVLVAVFHLDQSTQRYIGTDPDRGGSFPFGLELLVVYGLVDLTLDLGA